LPQALATLIQRCWDPQPEKRPPFSEIVLLLESLVVDAIIPEDSLARTFWKSHFLDPLQEAVAWFDIEDTVAKIIKMSPALLGRIGELLCTGVTTATSAGVAARIDPATSVTLEKFQQFYVWFGPWFEVAGNHIIHEINTLTLAPWFHGDISSTEAAARLQNRADGTFLVRLSTSVKQCPFTLSIANSQDPTSAQHIRIYRLSYAQAAPGGRYAMEITEKSWRRTQAVPDLVEALRLAFAIRDPCPKSKLPPSYKRLSGNIPPLPPASQ
jgi:hypothetical protein